MAGGRGARLVGTQWQRGDPPAEGGRAPQRRPAPDAPGSPPARCRRAAKLRGELVQTPTAPVEWVAGRPAPSAGWRQVARVRVAAARRRRAVPHAAPPPRPESVRVRSKRHQWNHPNRPARSRWTSSDGAAITTARCGRAWRPARNGRAGKIKSGPTRAFSAEPQHLRRTQR